MPYNPWRHSPFDPSSVTIRVPSPQEGIVVSAQRGGFAIRVRIPPISKCYADLDLTINGEPYPSGKHHALIYALFRCALEHHPDGDNLFAVRFF